jgi:hypothetical protein
MKVLTLILAQIYKYKWFSNIIIIAEQKQKKSFLHAYDFTKHLLGTSYSHASLVLLKKGNFLFVFIYLFFCIHRLVMSVCYDCRKGGGVL